ncbi:MAG TPA: metallophosphoesterase family protein [Gemmatales bacterium]|nr:metallophosphoesterase family protein [Gemmatales bacterium]
MHTWAIGDVHGCLTALNTLLSALELKPEDKLIFLGDLLDRGPDSRGVLERIFELKEQRSVEVIQGNHEEMLLIARDLPGYARVWQMYGGRETLASYGVNNPDYETWQHAIPEQHWQFFREGMVDAVEENDFVLVHGGYDPHLPWEKQPWDEFRGLKWNKSEPHGSGKGVVCGHTHPGNCLPVSVGHAICIDTWVYGSDGWLTALELESRSYVQANQQGMVRARRDLRVS